MISLEGLTLTTGRSEEAGFLLRTFAHYVRDGLIPNMFPEGQKSGLYHTADATLWFFHAIDRYVEAIHAYSLFRGEVVTFAYEQWYRGACEMRGAEGGFKRAVALMEPRSYWQRRSVADLLL